MYWVRQLASPKLSWVQLTVEPKCIEFDNLSNSCYLRVLGLTTYLFYVILGSTNNWIKVNWILYIDKSMLTRVQLTIVSKYIGCDNLSAPLFWVFLMQKHWVKTTDSSVALQFFKHMMHKDLKCILGDNWSGGILSSIGKRCLNLVLLRKGVLRKAKQILWKDHSTMCN